MFGGFARLLYQAILYRLCFFDYFLLSNLLLFVFVCGLYNFSYLPNKQLNNPNKKIEKVQRIEKNRTHIRQIFDRSSIFSTFFFRFSRFVRNGHEKCKQIWKSISTTLQHINTQTPANAKS